MHSHPSGFNEADYLSANPDVPAAVRSGACPSAATHWELYGKKENRPLNRQISVSPESLNASRRGRILAGLDTRTLRGLEIGALASPLVLPTEGDILFVDHVDTDALREKYRSDPSVDVANIANVGAVWGSQTLQDCLGQDRKVDYVLASHVVEHVPDLITWLAEIRSVLRRGGALRLAVPDRRFTFDYLRAESKIHDVLDAYIRRARVPLPRLILEHYSLVREVDREAAWAAALDPAQLRPVHTIQDGLEVAQNVLTEDAYHDVHCWVFTPNSFAGLCTEIARLGLLGFACDFLFETRRNEFEFIVGMTPSDDRDQILESWGRIHERGYPVKGVGGSNTSL
jgi:SAM-dependent methyltransferase